MTPPWPAASTHLFDAGPPLRLERRLGLVTADRPRVLQRAALAVAVGWAPLVVLSVAETLLFGGDRGKSLLADFAVHGRSLIAAPLLILAEHDGLPRLGSIARHFLRAGLVPATHRPRFDHAIASTRRRLDSSVGELIALALAYTVVAALMLSLPATEFAAWHLAGPGPLPRFSLAGWWNGLVSVPLLLVLVIGWLWRVLLWARFLWLMARLPLRLIPGHPDHAGGLQFVATSLWAFWVPSFALGSVTAGAIANRVVHHGASPFEYSRIAIGLAVFVLVLFAGPLLVFMGQLRDAKRRGMFEYGALAGSVGEAFERKWLKHAGNADAKALEVGHHRSLPGRGQHVRDENRPAQRHQPGRADRLGPGAPGAGVADGRASSRPRRRALEIPVLGTPAVGGLTHGFRDA